MKTLSLLFGVAGVAGVLAGCSKSPASATAQDPGPDNAFTRYGEGLAQSERHAKEVADRANANIARQQEQMNQQNQAVGQ